MSWSLTCENQFQFGLSNQVTSFNFIVPVYRELQSGNLHKFIENIHDQKGFDGKLRILFVVNNTYDIAAQKDTEAFLENQETLDYLKDLQDNNSTNIDFVIIDLATSGFERNMGRLRQVAVHRLMQMDLGVNDIVVHADSDTVYPIDFLSKLNELYSSQPRAEAFFLQRSYDLRKPERSDLLKSHISYKLKRLQKDFKNFFSRYSRGFATYQITSRASTLFSTKGFEPLERNEDTEFSSLLVRRSSYLANGIRVSTEDRARPESFTGALRFDELAENSARSKASPTQTSALIYRILTRSLSKKLIKDVQTGKVDFSEAVERFRKRLSVLFGIEPHLQKDMKYYSEMGSAVPLRLNPSPKDFDQEMGPLEDLFEESIYERKENWGSFFLTILARTLDHQELETLEQRINEALEAKRIDILTRRERLVDAINGILVASEDPFLHWVQSPSSDFKDYIENRGINIKDTHQISDQLLNDFSEWLSPIDKNSQVRELIILQEILDFLAHALRAPDDRPTTYRFLKSLEITN